MRFSPFATSRRVKFQEVRTETSGSVYLEISNGIHPIERTEKVQELEAQIAELERDRIELLWNVLKISEREAVKQGITTDEARQRIFGGAPKEAEEGTGVEIVRDSPISYVQTESELRSLMGDGSKDDESKRLKRKLREMVATNILASRLGWTVEVERAKSGSVQLSTSRPILYGLNAGQQIRFGETVVTVSDSAAEWEEIIPVNKLTAPVEGVGFLLDDAGREKVGADWTKEMTAALLVDSEIDEIYKFFLEQDAGGASAVAKAAEETSEETPDEQLGNSSASLSEGASPPPLTGEKSSSASKRQVAKIGG